MLCEHETWPELAFTVSSFSLEIKKEEVEVLLTLVVLRCAVKCRGLILLTPACKEWGQSRLLTALVHV
jgi:hypothetical protein